MRSIDFAESDRNGPQFVVPQAAPSGWASRRSLLEFKKRTLGSLNCLALVCEFQRKHSFNNAGIIVRHVRRHPRPVCH